MATSIRDLKDCVFTPPPDDLPLEFALDFHFKKNPNHPALIHPTEDGSCLKSYSYRDLVPAIHRTGQWILDAISFQRSAGPHRDAPVVVILIKTDTMTYLTVMAGLMRAGVTVLPISPRFSSTVIAHLLKTSRPQAIIFNNGTQFLANMAIQEYVKTGMDSPILCELPSFSFLYPGHNMYDPLPTYEREAAEITIMAHSSSSSSLFPRIISWSSNAILHHGDIKDMPVHDFAGQILGSFGLELFHSLGMCIFFTMIRRGLVLGIMNPSEQTSVLPADMNDVFRCFELTRPSFVLTNPRAIELWAEDPKKVEVLRDSRAAIVYGGRFLSKSIGDRLVQSGVKICSTYGSTETGPVTLLPRRKYHNDPCRDDSDFYHRILDFQGDDWEYWAVYPRPDLNFVRREDGLFELVVAPTEGLVCLPISNTLWDGRMAYNTGDLFIAHATKAHTYRMFGRSSDQIMLATGEMVNPIEIESELSRHPLVSSATMFGHSRFSVGIVIEPKSTSRQDKETTLSEKDFMDQIWPIIADFNLKAPSYSTISRKTIVLANAKKPILVSPKGLPRRPIVWQEYQDEIDALYANESRISK